MTTPVKSPPVLRVDKFVVPIAGRAEFLERVAQTHTALRAQAGFVQDMILEQESGPGEFNFVTLVEWATPEAFERASSAMHTRQAAAGFDPQAVMARLNIQADMANYKRLDI